MPNGNKGRLNGKKRLLRGQQLNEVDQSAYQTDAKQADQGEFQKFVFHE
jgi:hypothetical protein